MAEPPSPKRVKVVATLTGACTGAVADAKADGSDLVASFLGSLIPVPVPLGIVEMFLFYIGLAGQAALVITSKQTLSVVSAVRSLSGHPQRCLRALFSELDHHEFASGPNGDARALRLIQQRMLQKRVARCESPELIPVSLPPLSTYAALIDIRGAEADDSRIQVSSYIPSNSIRFDEEVPGNILLDIDAVMEDEWSRSVILPLAKNDNLWITLHFHLVGTERYLLVFSGRYSVSFLRSFSEYTSLDVWQSMFSYALSKNNVDAAIWKEKLQNGSVDRPVLPFRLEDTSPCSSLDFVRSRCGICGCREGREKHHQIGSAHGDVHYNDYERNNFIPLDHDELVRPDQFLFLPKTCKCCKCNYNCHRIFLRLSFRGMDGGDVDTQVGALWMLRKLAMCYKRDGSGCKL